MTAPIATWLAAPLGSAVASALRKLADADDVARIAVMPDVHLAEDVCSSTASRPGGPPAMGTIIPISAPP